MSRPKPPKAHPRGLGPAAAAWEVWTCVTNPVAGLVRWACRLPGDLKRTRLSREYVAQRKSLRSLHRDKLQATRRELGAGSGPEALELCRELLEQELQDQLSSLRQDYEMSYHKTKN